jgi:hypothetical protein
MATILDKPLKRELSIGPHPFTLTISPLGLKLTEKGHRKGIELAWADLVNGEAALATALNATLLSLPKPKPTPGRLPKVRRALQTKRGRLGETRK